MATNAHNALENLVWRMESISPTDTTSANKFRFVDIERLDPDEMPHAMRLFAVRWQGSAPDFGPTDLYDRWADHTFDIEVYYPVGPGGMSTRKLQKMLLRDRHDIAKALRDPSKFVGYDASNTSTDVGIKNRVMIGDALDRNNPAVWTYRASWRLTIQEVE